MYKPDFIAGDPKEIVLPEDGFEGYIFDCDGTVADTMSCHYTAWRDSINQQESDFTFEVETFFSLAGMGRKETVDVLNKRYGLNIDADKLAVFKEMRMTSLMSHIRPVESVFRFAKEAAIKGIPISIASGGTRDVVLKTLEIIGAKDLFPVIVCNADVKFGKPAPDIFLLAAEKMRVVPEKCLVFEDSFLGIEAAALAGMKSILIGREHTRFNPNLA